MGLEKELLVTYL